MESIRALWCAVAFTITSMEMSNREQGVAFFGKDVPSSTQLTLKYLTRLGGSVLNAPTKVKLIPCPALHRTSHKRHWVTTN